MRLVKLAVLLALLSIPLVFTSSAAALDLCDAPECQPPSGEQNTPYEWAFETEEGCVPYRAAYQNGTLPPGLRVTTDGKLVGTPTEAGTFEFWATLDDNSGPHNPACQVVSPQSQGKFVIHVLPDLAVMTESLPRGAPGRAYSAQLQFSNPEVGWPVIWDITAGSLPAGLSLSESGLISGTPTGPDVKQVTVRAREPFRRSGEKQLTLAVGASFQASAVVRPGEVGLRYSAAIRAAGGQAPLAWSITSGSLPRGLALNTATGAITGIPRAAGSSAVRFAVTDAAGQSVSVATTFRIAARVAVATRQLPAAITGKPYLARFRAAGGLAPTQWRIVRGSLPRGIKLNARTGYLTGVARRTGTYRVVIQVTDRLGARSTRSFSLSVVG